MQKLTFTTPRLTLREVENSDQQKIFEGFSNPVVTKYMDVTYPTFEATAEQMLWYETKRKNGTGNSWAVINEHDDFIGVVSTYNLHPLHRRCEIGYWFFPKFWGKGYATESAKASIEYGFKEMNLDKICAHAHSGNEASIYTLKKLGFVEKETFIDDLDGVKCYWYEIKNNEFSL